MSFSEQIKKSTGGDEYYSPQNVVDMILPFLVQSGYKKIWCPFALVMNFNGLFDSKARAQMFAKNGVELLIPYGRMKFEHEGEGLLNKPNFQSVYVCHEFLKSPIVFSGAEF